MPRRDGTGPMGMGTLTGRGFGPCAGSRVLKYGAGLGLGLGLGLACRRGFGSGWGRGYDYAADEMPAKDKQELLNKQRELLKSRLESIEAELESM